MANPCTFFAITHGPCSVMPSRLDVMPTIRLIYASLADPTLSYRDMTELLRRATSHNKRTGITGVLVLAEHVFLQVLEGERGAVNRLYHRIAADHRHSSQILLEYKPVFERQFDRWTMRLIRWVGEPTAARRACLLHHFGTLQLEPWAMNARQAIAFLTDVSLLDDPERLGSHTGIEEPDDVVAD
jgi:hypothetical protein